MAGDFWRKDLWLKLISLLTAFIIWFYVVTRVR
jgi:hypothetical protein